MLDADGKMIGIVTSSDESASALYTMVTLIWDALLKSVSPAWPPGYWPPGGGLLNDLLDPEEGWRLHGSSKDEFRYEFDPAAPCPSPKADACSFQSGTQTTVEPLLAAALVC